MPILRLFVTFAVVVQFSCQMSQSANDHSETNSPTIAVAQSIKLLPVDQGTQDSSFAEFRNRLLMAVRDHDLRFVLTVIDRNIINGSDTERGIKQFRIEWKLNQGDGRLWETLASILAMGGSFRVNDSSKEFCAPYVTSEWSTVVSRLPKDADPLDYQAILANEVEMKSEPKSDASTVAILNYDVVRVFSASASSETNPSWVRIATLSGQHGFVAAEYLRSPSDYHACFKRVGRNWLMTELAALE